MGTAPTTTDLNDFIPATKAKSSEVDANFNYLIAVLTDQTYDLTPNRTNVNEHLVGQTSVTATFTIPVGRTYHAAGFGELAAGHSHIVPTGAGYIGFQQFHIASGATLYVTGGSFAVV